MKNCLLIDCNDSFSYKLAQTVRQTGLCEVDVIEYGHDIIHACRLYDAVIISPGPGLPNEYSHLFRLLKSIKNKPLLGVCLGHQLMAIYCGGQLGHLPQVMHGQKKSLDVCNDDALFAGVPGQCQVGLYHSWVIEAVPQQLIVTARSDDGFIMACRHETYPWTSVQFHPESFMTKDGTKIIQNWISGVM